MRTRVLIAVAAVFLGAVAAFAAGRYLAGARARLAADAKPIEVLVASGEVPKGMGLDEMKKKGLVETRQVPRQFVAAGAISSPRKVEERVLAVPVTAGEQLTEAKFQFPSDAGLACSVPEGYLAVAIPTDPERGVAGLLKPGDHVAVVVTMHCDDDTKAQTNILLPKARVLAIGRAVGTEPEEESERAAERRAVMESGSTAQEQAAAGTVTLALSPADVERLVLAEEQGKVWLALLPATETSPPTSSGQTLATMLR